MEIAGLLQESIPAVSGLEIQPLRGLGHVLSFKFLERFPPALLSESYQVICHVCPTSSTSAQSEAKRFRPEGLEYFQKGIARNYVYMLVSM